MLPLRSSSGDGGSEGSFGVSFVLELAAGADGSFDFLRLELAAVADGSDALCLGNGKVHGPIMSLRM